MGISVKPSSKDTTGIGPASDRRRARRTGRMGWRAAVHCVAAFDVPRPTKNPRRLALQVSILNPALFRKGCDAGVHRLLLRMEVLVVLPSIAFCFITRFRRGRLLGET